MVPEDPPSHPVPPPDHAPPGLKMPDPLPRFPIATWLVRKIPVFSYLKLPPIEEVPWTLQCFRLRYNRESGSATGHAEHR